MRINKTCWGVLVISLVSIIVGCTRGDIIDSISYAESIVTDNPQEALDVMTNIPRRAVRGKHNQARYALVYSEALYHNFIDVDKDTLTRGMAEYYLESDYHSERARALYQYALVKRMQGELAEAMLMLEEAEVSLAVEQDDKLLALIHRTKGDIYNDGCLFTNALNSYAEALELFGMLGLDYHYHSLLYDVGATEIQTRDFEEAKRYLAAALEYGVESQRRDFICAVLHEFLELSIYMDDYDACGELLDMFERYDALLYGEAHYYAVKAMYISRSGGVEEALELLRSAEMMEDVEWADIDYARYIVYRNAGDTANALLWQEYSKHSQDALMLEVLEQPVLNVQLKALREKLSSARRERELIAQRNTMITIAVVIVALVLVMLVVRRMKRKNEELEHYVAAIGELQDTLKMLPQEMAASVGALYRDRFSDLNELCDIYYEHEGTARSKSVIYNKFMTTIEAMKSDNGRLQELEATVNKYRGGVMEILRREMPRLSERDMRVALYIFAGFSNRAIAIFIDSDPVSVSKLRYNIKQKIKSANIADGEVLIAALSEK
jgi:tetratricopeptide (TPR) repeat protein